MGLLRFLAGVLFGTRATNGLTICMVTLNFFPEYSGAALAALNLSLILMGRGLQVFVVTGDSFSLLPRVDEVMGIRVYRLPISFLRWRYSKYLFQIGLWLFFLFNRDFDIIHVHGLGYHAYGVLRANRVIKKRCLVTMAYVSDPIGIIGHRPHRKVYLQLLPTADGIISKSREMSSHYLQAGLPKDKLSYIPNGVNINNFYPLSSSEKLRLRERLGLKPKELVFIFVGPINTDLLKGVDLLVASWIKVVREFPSARLLIVGPVNSMDILEELKGQLRDGGAEGTVNFVGYVHNVKDYLQAADVFAFPTRGEGLPNALLEAMACGLPPVAGKLDCTAEVVEHGRDGFLCPHEVSALTHYLLELGRNAPLREAMGREARKTMEEKFSLDKTTDKYIDLYGKLVNQAG